MLPENDPSPLRAFVGIHGGDSFTEHLGVTFSLAIDRTKKGRKRDKVKSQRLRHDSYISRGVIFPGRDICGRSSL